MSASRPVIPWEQLIQEKLISRGYFEGLCLVSHQKEVVYVYGVLGRLSKTDIDQLFTSFYCQDSDINYHSLSLNFSAESSEKKTFRIYQRSLVSIYATLVGSKVTLTVSRLPIGIFVSLSHKSVLPHKALTVLEDFTASLRV